MKRKRVALFSLLLLVLVLSACTGGLPFTQNPRANQNRDYYVGTDGVIMRFSDPSAPPARLFYYETAGIDENAFQILVDVHNIGSSWTMGALYVSGYDPYMIRIDNIDIKETGFWGNCFFNVNFFGGGNTRSSADCQNLDLEWVEGDGWGIGINSLGQLLGSDSNFLQNLGITFDNIGEGYDFGVSTNSLDLDTYNHGFGLLVWANGAGMSLTRYNGLNYQGEVAGAGVLQPDYPQFPGGEMNTISFDGYITNWPQGLDRTDRPINFLVTNCFLYSTVATPQVCIDPAPYDQGIKVCQPRRITFNGGNGAPIVITSIEQENARRKVFFDINIRNAGGGTVFDVGAMEACSPYFPGRLTTQHLDRVYILDARIAGNQLRCTPDRANPVRLINGEGNFRCEYDMEFATAKSAYETPLVLELGYGYSTTMRRQTTIRRVP